MQPLPIHKLLVKRGGYWRLDGIGEVARNEAKASITLEYIFSEVHPNSVNDKYQKTSITGESLHLHANAVFIRHFPAGGIWIGDKLVVQAPELDNSNEYVIDSRHALNFKRGEIATLGSNRIAELIPDSYFSMSADSKEKLRNSPVTVFPTMDGSPTKYLIIPDAEIFRFYYGLSGDFVKHILSGTTAELFSIKDQDPTTGLINIDIYKSMPNEQKALIALWNSSHSAREKMFNIRKGIQNQSYSNRLDLSPETHLKASMPFDDYTTLRVQGKKVRLTSLNGNPPVWATYVMRIVQCGYQYDFNKIISHRSQRHKLHLKKTEPKTEHGDILSRVGEINFHDTPIVDGNANPSLKRASPVDGQPVSRPGVSEIEFKDIVEQGNEDFEKSGKRAKTTTEAVTHEAGAHGQNSLARGIDGRDSNKIIELSRLSGNLGKFISCLEFLTRTKKIKFESVDFGSRIKYGTYAIIEFTTPASCTRKWGWIFSENPIRKRHLLSVMVSSDGFPPIYLVELENTDLNSKTSTILLCRKDCTALDDSLFTTFLELTAYDYGWPSDNFYSTDTTLRENAADFREKVSMSRVKHPRSSLNENDYIAKWSDMIYSKITDLKND